MKLWADRRRLGSIAAPASWMLDNPWLCFVSRSREPAPGKVASSHAHTSQFALMRAKPGRTKKRITANRNRPRCWPTLIGKHSGFSESWRVRLAETQSFPPSLV
jgi:hypothetical protein